MSEGYFALTFFLCVYEYYDHLFLFCTMCDPLLKFHFQAYSVKSGISIKKLVDETKITFRIGHNRL
ncbi:MAG: hypothetical protein BWX63_01337 [Bacteroidetes bacterium ADurb.Bin041]|nr:MAG: hypothetical protein BWX63_01337 [Bacteroidetes bacterium ADurb.Bin041]